MTRYSLRVIIRILAFGMLSVAGIVMTSRSAVAQNVILPDDSLGEETSVVQSFREDVDFILGGAKRGENLFHSFEEFNIDEFNGAYFTFPIGLIDNVFARVTGENSSEILGVLGTLEISENFQRFSSEANLYLINPNGIIFGENSSLAI
ncbi:MAG: filamentous hemagglutinin N-terminal domain-containing protein, partial [Erythrobacter sp.]